MGPERLRLSSFSPGDDRERLMAAFAVAVYECGFTPTSLAEVARRADVRLEQVQAHWPTPVDCLLDTAATTTRRIFARAATAFMEADGDVPLALHRALTIMMYDMVGAPELTYLAVVELPRLGPLTHDRQERMLDLFCELLVSSFAALDEPLPSREIVELSIAGGLWEAIYRHAAQRRLHELPDALAAISFVCVSTFFGADEALRVSALTRLPAAEKHCRAENDTHFQNLLANNDVAPSIKEGC